MKTSDIESVFREFVRDFGGEVLPEDPENKTADFLFRSQKIVAELKCLMIDQTEEMKKKLGKAVVKAVEKDPSILTLHGHEELAIATAPPAIQSAWLNILIAPIENIIKDANRQIRATKEQLNLPDAKGLVLIFNHANQLHVRPQDFRMLLARVLRKKAQGGQLRFSHVEGVVYFSYKTVKAEPLGTSFWMPLQNPPTPEDDGRYMGYFQIELRKGWYAYIEKMTGVPVRDFDAEGALDSKSSD